MPVFRAGIPEAHCKKELRWVGFLFAILLLVFRASIPEAHCRKDLCWLTHSRELEGLQSKPVQDES